MGWPQPRIGAIAVYIVVVDGSGRTVSSLSASIDLAVRGHPPERVEIRHDPYGAVQGVHDR